MIGADELIVDSFAGGGGASLGISLALGRAPDVAINHDAEAVALHSTNHPETEHYCANVWQVDPAEVVRRYGGRRVGLLWASPDCKHFSKAKGGRPVKRNIRDLAWVVVLWARRARPRVICLENVEEFRDWGPLIDRDGKWVPCPERRGATFERWVGDLRRLGYRVEYRELRACDYGAPTIRKRLFLVARCDGLPIVWPEPTHGAPDHPEVIAGRKLLWRTAAEIIDWSLPCPSIFERKRPLAETTMRRIAAGVRRFVLDAKQPFIVTYYGSKGEEFRGQSLRNPLATQTTENRHALVVPALVQVGYGERRGQSPRILDPHRPLGTIVGTQKHALVAAFLAKHYSGVVGSDLRQPIGTVTAVDHHSVVAAHMINLKGSDRRARAAGEPLSTVCAEGTHAGLVSAFMAPYYGSGSGLTGRDMREPSPTITTVDRLQLVTVQIDGVTYAITDIGMRMLQPHELFRAQGFPDSYLIELELNGKPLPKRTQVRLCGNSVCPPVAAALVRAQFTAAAEQRPRPAAEAPLLERSVA